MSSQAKPKQERWHRGTEERVCKFCGASYTAMAPHQQICSSEACRREQRNEIQRKRNEKLRTVRSAKQCVICGREFQASDSRRVTCGRRECVAANDTHTRRMQYERTKNGAQNASSAKYVDPSIREMSDTNVEIINWSMREKGMTFRQAAELAGWGRSHEIARERLKEKGYRVTNSGIEKVGIDGQHTERERRTKSAV